MTYVIPKLADFDADILAVEILPNVKLVINIPNVSVILDGKDVPFDEANVLILDERGDFPESIVCPTVVGFGNSFMSLLSDDATILGQPLSVHNIERCYFEVTDA